jgi:glycosyltransferase involved in cell wall biosynthesis
LTSSPPHSVQLIGLNLSKRKKIPWIADFRDPWAEIVYYQNVRRNLISKKIDGILEKKVLKKASKIITISNEIKNIFNSKVKREGIEVLPNGFDIELFSSIDEVKKIDKKISIVYAGVLSKERNPERLIEAFSKLTIEEKNKIEFNFFGTVNEGFVSMVKSKKLDQFFKFEGYRSYLEIAGILKNSNCLLLVIDRVPNNLGFLTGKLFDYLGAKQPILAIGPKGGDAEKIINDTESGWFLDYEDEIGLTRVLKSLILNDLNFSFKVENYSRKNQVKYLSKFLNQITGAEN